MLFNIGDMIDKSLPYTRDLFSDFSPYIFLFAGVGIGMKIIELLADLIEKRKEREDSFGGFSQSEKNLLRGKVFENAITMSDKEWRSKKSNINKVLKGLSEK